MPEVVAEEVDGVAGKETLVRVNNQAVLVQGGENRFQVPPMGRLVGASYQNVVQVDKSKGQVDQNRIHEPLKRHPALRRPKGMRVNSKSPNGVMMAVLAMSAAATGT
jgi:hypothetical protein